MKTNSDSWWPDDLSIGKTQNVSEIILSHDRHVIQWNNSFHKNHLITRVRNNTCTASHWLDQLAALLFILIRLLIATKMASDFGDATVHFEIDLVFNFEMNVRVQIDARENGKSLKKISTTPGDLT